MTYYRRCLPHWLPPNQDLFVTWRLHGSLPSHIPPPNGKSSPGQTFVHFDRLLDAAATGPHWLKNDRIAECVLGVMQEAQQIKMFHMHAYALMANHVHILITPAVPLEQITRHIKGGSARQANRILSLTGQRFWQDESYDHWVRGPEEFQKIRNYIERNPVAAGLVKRPEDYPHSSASYPIK